MVDVESADDLEFYLKETMRIAQEDRITTKLLTGGVSNKTVLVTVTQGDQFVVKQALEKLRVPVDWFSDPTRIIQEAGGIRVLSEYIPEGSIPRFLFLDEENLILAMEAVPEPHENYKSRLLSGKVEPELADQFATLLGMIHSKSSKDKDKLKEEFSGREIFKSLRLEPYYGYASTQVPEVAEFMNDLIEETLSFRISLVHGDYSPKNVLIHNGKTVLLDHEVIHLGDPTFDCGFAMTHYLSKAHHLKKHRREFLDITERFWKTYLESLGQPEWSGEEYEKRACRQLLGCLMARVAGRSVLEYLSEAEKEFQKQIVVSLINNPPETISELIQEFGRKIEND